MTLTHLAKKIAAKRYDQMSRPSLDKKDHIALFHHQIKGILQTIIELEMEDIKLNMSDNSKSPLKCLEKEINKRQT